MPAYFGGHPHPTTYVAQPKDNTLQSLLIEAFKLLELRFADYDADGIQIITFQQLQQRLAMIGFVKLPELANIFASVDADKNGTLDFSEFLCLLYLWCQPPVLGNYTQFFPHPGNASVVQNAFSLMAQCMVAYDQDKSRLLDINELTAFFRDQLPETVSTSAFTQVVDVLYPVHLRTQGAMGFPTFMQLIYEVLSKMPGSGLKGNYSQMKRLSNPTAGASKEESMLWQDLKKAFAVLEEDFARLDRDGGKYICKSEIAMGIPVTKTGMEKLDILSRLEYAFGMVDVDRSGALDFFEFLYLCFLMTQNGSYHDLIVESPDASAVKKAFIDIHCYYTKYDADGNKRLTWNEVEAFCTDVFGQVPPRLPDIWAQVKYQSGATGGQDCVDVVRFNKMLYMMVCPDGAHAPGSYSLAKPPQGNHLVSWKKTSTESAHLPRISPVVPAKFRSVKVLGQGGQGKVELGDYDGVQVAGKTFLGTPDANLVKETLDEVEFFMKLDHPNCHYMLGSKTTLEDGGIMLLTEVCEMGSIFDKYNKENVVFDLATALRLTRECALGFEHIHSMGYMHRDIKSLNVFLDKNYTAKVADFGMCTPQKTASDCAGTPQWMAPEVGLNALGTASQYDNKVDVYSFAILMWELFHSRIPYVETGLDQMGILQQVVCNGARPAIDPRVPSPVAQIIQQCWSTHATARPTFSQVLASLDGTSSCCEQGSA